MTGSTRALGNRRQGVPDDLGARGATGHWSHVTCEIRSDSAVPASDNDLETATKDLAERVGFEPNKLLVNQ
jgi:hypothetical protein